jgi:hypothetical protein
MDLMTGFQFSVGAKDFSVFHSIQTDSGAQGASYIMGTGTIFSRVKRQKREADHLPPSSIEVKSTGAITPLLFMPS